MGLSCTNVLKTKIVIKKVSIFFQENERCVLIFLQRYINCCMLFECSCFFLTLLFNIHFLEFMEYIKSLVTFPIVIMK